MNPLIIFSLLVLTLSQSCSNCNTGYCSLVTTGISTCSYGECTSNAFSVPLVTNGVNYTYNGNLVWQCQLCSAGGSNCEVCQYDPNMNSQMVCSTCAAGYAPIYPAGEPANTFGTCQPCPTGCLTCSFVPSGSDGCGPYATGDCGISTIGGNMLCSQCAPNYVMADNSNCYYCPATSTAALINSSTQNNSLVIGLIIWTVLATVCSSKNIIIQLRSLLCISETDRQRA